MKKITNYVLIIISKKFDRLLYEELEAENDSQALEKTVNFLKEQENVENAAIGDDNTSIWIKYSSGVEAIILTKSFGTLNIDFPHRFKANQSLLKD